MEVLDDDDEAQCASNEKTADADSDILSSDDDDEFRQPDEEADYRNDDDADGLIERHEFINRMRDANEQIGLWTARALEAEALSRRLEFQVTDSSRATENALGFVFILMLIISYLIFV